MILFRTNPIMTQNLHAKKTHVRLIYTNAHPITIQLHTITKRNNTNYNTYGMKISIPCVSKRKRKTKKQYVQSYGIKQKVKLF